MVTPLATSVRSTASTGWRRGAGGWCMSHHCTLYWSQRPSVSSIACCVAGLHNIGNVLGVAVVLFTLEKRSQEYFICHNEYNSCVSHGSCWEIWMYRKFVIITEAYRTTLICIFFLGILKNIFGQHAIRHYLVRNRSWYIRIKEI